MKNKEKFKDEILDIICKGGNIAVDNITYEPVDCDSIDCGSCLFYDCGGLVLKCELNGLCENIKSL